MGASVVVPVELDFEFDFEDGLSAFLGLDLACSSVASLSQFLGPLREDVGYEGGLSWVWTWVADVLLAGVEVKVVLVGSFEGVAEVGSSDFAPSSEGHFWPGLCLVRVSSTLVDRTRCLDVSGLIIANRGSIANEKVDDGLEGLGKEIET